MNNIVEEIIGVEDAIHSFVESDLYSASIRFFNLMNYPIVSSLDKANLDVNKFIYSAVEKCLYFNKFEMEHCKMLRLFHIYLS